MKNEKEVRVELEENNSEFQVMLEQGDFNEVSFLAGWSLALKWVLDELVLPEE